MQIMSDPQAMTAALEGGALDTAINVPVTDFVRLRDDPKFQPYLFSAGNFSCFGINCQSPPWDNKEARQALQYAVDRERCANTSLQGLEVAVRAAVDEDLARLRRGQGECVPVRPRQGQVDAAGGGRHRPDRRRRDHAEQPAPELTAFGQVLQSDFAKLGITLTLRPQEQASYLDIVNNWKYKGFWLGGGSFAQLDPATGFTKSRALSVAGNSSAFTTPANAAAVELLGRGTTEPDPAKRKQIYSDLNDMLLQEAYIITMSPEVTRLMQTTKVQGIASTLHSAQKWWEAWLA